MTLRERIADWISGGDLTFWKDQSSSLAAQNSRLLHNIFIDADRQDRLTRIAAQETPSANATVRRMARIARGEE